jgi:hypothetical protein
MNQERETPKFQGIADLKCKCTPDQLCRRCAPSSPGTFARYIDQIPDRFRGKFRTPWNDAVKYNNAGVKNGGEK